MGRAVIELAPDEFERLLRGGRLSVWTDIYVAAREGQQGVYERVDIDLASVHIVAVDFYHAVGTIDITVEGATLPKWHRGHEPMRAFHTVDAVSAPPVPTRTERAYDLEGE